MVSQNRSSQGFEELKVQWERELFMNNRPDKWKPVPVSVPRKRVSHGLDPCDGIWPIEDLREDFFEEVMLVLRVEGWIQVNRWGGGDMLSVPGWGSSTQKVVLPAPAETARSREQKQARAERGNDFLTSKAHRVKEKYIC